MRALGVQCPRPDELIRGAIIGAATITAVVANHDSPWFFGPRGLVLADAQQVEPRPARGALGYFAWRAGGQIATPLPWMRAWPDLGQTKIRQRCADQSTTPELLAIMDGR